MQGHCIDGLESKFDAAPNYFHLFILLVLHMFQNLKLRFDLQCTYH